MSEQVAIVSGSSGGIGAEVCAMLAAQGWRVVGLDLAASLEPERHVSGDATCEESWEEARLLAQDSGELRVIVNNAGVQGEAQPLAGTDLESFRRIARINVESAFLGTRLGLRHLSPGGAVVNVASSAGSRGVPRYGPYVAAKHAVVGLTRTAALEGARKGIRVNAVAPGPTQTPIMDAVVRRQDSDATAVARDRMERANPMGRFARPREIAEAIAWLADPRASYVNGAVVALDGGLTAG